MIRWFAWYAPRFVRKHFNAVRILGDTPPGDDPRSWLIYLNHPSWWDPMALAVLMADRYRDRAGYGPIDAVGLEKYRFMEKLGFFGLDLASPAGAKRFLQLGEAILATPGETLWVTAQGHFTDARARPVALRPGVAHLVRRGVREKLDFAVYPLAVEYPFWDEKQPEMLLHFGEPIALDGGLDAAAWNARLEAGLAAAMDELRAAALTRDPGRFGTLLDGSRGVNVFYDLWRRGRARVRGERFAAGHRDEGVM